MVGLRGPGRIALLVLLGLAMPATPAAAAPRPNVVVIVTDDQTLGSFNESVMPVAFRKLVDRGVTFSQGIVSTPQCCPSRAGLLTGQYAHNNGVTANRPGYPMLGQKASVLPSWLRAAGYRTIHIGKYLNGYTGARGLSPGPGWDRWKTITAADYQDPVFSIDGRLRGDRDRYLTRTLNLMASRAVSRNAPRRRPFYLQLDHLAPHAGSGREESRCRKGAIPAAGDEQLFAQATAPRNPATEEADVSDKPEFLRRRPPPGGERRERIDRFYGCGLAALASVDRGVKQLISALRRSGELRRTMVVFTSDNGYAFGEHRASLAKGLPYEEHLRVPFVIRPPRGFPRRSRSGAASDAPVANIDLAPTILRVARAAPCRRGGRACRRMDGRSLVGLLRGRSPAWTRDRAIRTGFSANSGTYGYSCEWAGLRSPTVMLVHHLALPAPETVRCEPADELELYDLASDPFQLQADRQPPDELRARLDSLRRCSGIPGRDRPLPGTPFCE